MAEMRSTITCPVCGHRHSEIMPEDAIQYFYKCGGCGSVVKPKRGACCVFCSYGNVKCPTAQMHTRPAHRLGQPRKFA